MAPGWTRSPRFRLRDKPLVAPCAPQNTIQIPMAEDQIFRILPNQVDQTLSAALRGWLPGQSWSQIRKLLQSRRVMVSGNLCMDAGRRLTLRDVVKVLPHSMAPPPSAQAVRIYYLDEHVVVVEKPSGVTTVRHAEERDWPKRRRQLQPTLDEMLPRILAKNPRVQGPAVRPGEMKSAQAAGAKKHPPRRQSKGPPLPVRPVHRLDRETSGLIVFARTALAERHLAQQFRHHVTHRRYLAIAQGRVPAQTIASRLVRDRGDGRRGSTTHPELGKHAVTHIKPLEDLEGYTLVECRLETGRTHQIRIHLAEQGHPLCGEKVYHQPLFGAPLADASGAPRLALHAAELGFEHPVTGEHLRFEAALPPDLTAFLHRLRAGARAKPKSPRKGSK